MFQSPSSHPLDEEDRASHFLEIVNGARGVSSPADTAWLSCRVLGSQTIFTFKMGVRKSNHTPPPMRDLWGPESPKCRCKRLLKRNSGGNEAVEGRDLSALCDPRLPDFPPDGAPPEKAWKPWSRVFLTITNPSGVISNL